MNHDPVNRTLKGVIERLDAFANKVVRDLPADRQRYYRWWADKAIGYLRELSETAGSSKSATEPLKARLLIYAFEREWGALMREVAWELKELERRKAVRA